MLIYLHSYRPIDPNCDVERHWQAELDDSEPIDVVAPLRCLVMVVCLLGRRKNIVTYPMKLT